ncbi:peptidase inhibitor family I36 protein [Streptomyces sp. BR123]|uniref:peptidase inhibitor family I36 protein n=1 Tax=Streptomyces sp. BR123 TaxID=2749828 RepID=UPI0015C44E19|nr:peptidase inhibitor family I36 protein [Streptomyces sp. BR123]NXY93546.1 peptidase inhibitor family I36 protein [Streptomyces sp. BR123]
MRTSSPAGVTPARTASARAHAALAAAALVLAALLPGASGTAHAAPGGPARPAAGPPPRQAVPCATGQLCLWAQPGFKGKRHTHELSTLDVNSCTALPAGTSAQSLVNRTGRPVTTYQSAECAETGEFQTYPGDGVQLPESPYLVRAFKVWER